MYYISLNFSNQVYIINPVRYLKEKGNLILSFWKQWINKSIIEDNVFNNEN